MQDGIATATNNIEKMIYSFGTNDLKIAKSDDPNNMSLNNEGLKIYNLSTLISIFNKNGAGVNKLIVINSIQFQNLLLKKRNVTWTNPLTGTSSTFDVISGFWLKDLIETLHDLEG